jgi:dTDP-4-amino-4,6-dideoxygalactose transaminase
MIPLAIPNMAGNEARYLAECVATNFVSTVGPFVGRFEEQVASASGARNAVATSCGTTGLHVALVALGVRRDDLVIVPSFTFIATANAVAHVGATPWLLDVHPDTWTLDPQRLGDALDLETVRGADGKLVHVRTGRRVSAIVVVHTFGTPADMDEVTAIAQAHGLPLLSDAAAALGAEYKGRPVGRLGADLTMFSFNGNKTVTAGGGGAVAGDDDELLARVRHLSTTARIGANYDHDEVGFNYRMTNLQAAVGCAQMELLDRFVRRKREIRRAYDEGLAGISTVEPFPVPDWAESACWFSGFVTDPETADRVRTALNDEGIDARPTWKPMHLQSPYADAPRSDVSISDRIWRRIVTLPCSTGITDGELDVVVNAVRRTLPQ